MLRMRICRIPSRDQLVVFVEDRTPSTLAQRCGRYQVEIIGNAGHPCIFSRFSLVFYSLLTRNMGYTVADLPQQGPCFNSSPVPVGFVVYKVVLTFLF